MFPSTRNFNFISIFSPKKNFYYFIRFLFEHY